MSSIRPKIPQSTPIATKAECPSCKEKLKAKDAKVQKRCSACSRVGCPAPKPCILVGEISFCTPCLLKEDEYRGGVSQKVAKIRDAKIPARWQLYSTLSKWSEQQVREAFLFVKLPTVLHDLLVQYSIEHVFTVPTLPQPHFRFEMTVQRYSLKLIFQDPLQGGEVASALKLTIGKKLDIDPSTIEFKCKGQQIDNRSTMVTNLIAPIVMGRPYQGDAGSYVQASLSFEKKDWSKMSSLSPSHLKGLSSTLRKKLAQEWTQIALAEHASIASFQQHILLLLCLNVPSSIIEKAQRASMDEVEHAKFAFMFAEFYSQQTIQPACFPVCQISSFPTLVSMTMSTIEEGCIEETISALLLAISVAQTQIAEIRCVLKQILKDETNHASLAWETVRWACNQKQNENENNIQKEVWNLFSNKKLELEKEEIEMEELESELESELDKEALKTKMSDCDLMPYGHLPKQLKNKIKVQIKKVIILPMAEVLFSHYPLLSTSECQLGFKKIIENCMKTFNYSQNIEETLIDLMDKIV